MHHGTTWQEFSLLVQGRHAMSCRRAPQCGERRGCGTAAADARFDERCSRRSLTTNQLRHMELLDECARDKAGMRDDWSPYSFRCLPPHPQETELVEVIGAVAPLKTRGKSKGSHNWDKMDKSTKRVVYITLKEHSEWVKAWEAKTGNCATCRGTGNEWRGWSVNEGSRYNQCTKCHGSGKSNDKVSDGGPLTPELKQDANPPFAAPLG